MATYNPYKAARQIVRNKGAWSSARAAGKSGDEYHTKALTYYRELDDNGWGELAKQLEGADYNAALNILDSLEAEADGYSPEKQLAESESDSAALRSRATVLADVLEKSYGELYDEIKNFDPENSTVYKAVSDKYTEAGEKAAMSAVANRAAENAGNTDSYAAANAHRQNAAYLNAGSEAAKNAVNERYAALLDTLEGLGENATKSAASLLELLDSDRETAEKVLADGLNYAAAKERNGAAVSGIGIYDTASDRRDKYVNLLLEAYPEYAGEICDIFNWLG